MIQARESEAESNTEAQLKASCSRRLKAAFRRLANSMLKSESELLRELAERAIAGEELGDRN